jgi:mannose/fructose/N-acetylgalactosamine-specific phosphotransferase system component IID
MTSVLTWRIRLQVWLRLIVLQASWNFEWLQGTGFLYAICPALKQLYPDAEDLREACQRHACYFNTHPYLAPLVVGAVLRLEEDRAAGDHELYVSIEEFKDMMAAPCAAIGDALFWGGLRPLIAGITLFFAIKGILWAPLIYLLLYNLVPLWFRTFFFVRGYRLGIRSVEFLQRYRLPDWAIHTKEAAVIVLGGLSAFMVFIRLDQTQHAGWLGFFVLLPMIITGLAARKGVSIQLLVYSVVVCIVLLGVFWADLMPGVL